LILEHPRAQGAVLAEPSQAAETTAEHYRFEVELPAGETKRFTVETRRPIEERIELLRQDVSRLVYLSRRSLPREINRAWKRAAAILQRQAEAERELDEAAKAASKLVAEQKRIRENLAAVGTSTRPGANYQRRLEAVESRLDELASREEAANQAVERAKAEFADFVAGLDFP
jgi:chromosome segregation ATPase